MSFSTGNEFDRNAVVADAEKALRLIATLPAPEGIEERVKSGLLNRPRRAEVIHWPFAAGHRNGWMHSAAMRAAAVAAIVIVVAGGGWEVYSHIRIAPEPAAIAAPQPMDGHSSLSAAGAMRTPQTLQGPKAPAAANAKQKANPGDAPAAQSQKVARKKRILSVPVLR